MTASESTEMSDVAVNPLKTCSLILQVPGADLLLPPPPPPPRGGTKDPAGNTRGFQVCPRLLGPHYPW